MIIRDNRGVGYAKIAEGKIISVCFFGNGISITLDTGYNVYLEHFELEEINAKKDEKEE